MQTRPNGLDRSAAARGPRRSGGTLRESQHVKGDIERSLDVKGGPSGSRRMPIGLKGTPGGFQGVKRSSEVSHPRGYGGE